jgi:Histidine kinase-like ATPase domain
MREPMTFSSVSGRTGTVRQPRVTGSAEHDSGAGPAFQPPEEGAGLLITSGWPRRSYLDLAALPGAVPCARLHTRQVLWEWNMGAIAETAELLVSELLTNAIRAVAAELASGRSEPASAAGIATVRFWLAADGQQVLIQVWDRCHWKPQPQEPGPEAESGRGLLLVEALSSQWGSFTPNGWTGKVVWAVVTAAR